MSMSSVAVPSPGWTWLMNPRFDLTFIVGLPVLASLTAGVVVMKPELFLPILLLDLWFLGYHHVIATYTRLCFDKASYREHKSLIWWLLPIVAISTIAVSMAVGIWAIVTIYFYWQWFHYTRQSWGVSRAYRGKDREALYEDGWLDQAIFYAIPVTGILYRSHQNPGKFIGFDLAVLPVPAAVVYAAMAISGALLAYWVARRMVAFVQGRLALTHTLYMLSHFAIFAIGYVLIEDVTYGWLAINIWHNAQYILFVWMFNTRRFKDGEDKSSPFLSYISQPQRIITYMAFGVMLTGVVYWGVLGTLSALLFSGLSATIVLYQIANFHHYVVDSLIWKVRSKPVAQTLGLAH